MRLIPPQQTRLLAEKGRVASFESLLDLPPIVKLYTPDAGGTWLLSATDPADADRAWGLCDPGLGSPELGWVSLAELASLRGPLRMEVQRDEAFRPTSSLRAYLVEAKRVGIIIA